MKLDLYTKGKDELMYYNMRCSGIEEYDGAKD